LGPTEQERVTVQSAERNTRRNGEWAKGRKGGAGLRYGVIR
jgi:hypothetical protein